MQWLVLISLLVVAFIAGAAVRDWQTRRDWRKWQRQLERNPVSHYRRTL